MKQSVLKTMWFTPSRRSIQTCPSSLWPCLTEPGSLTVHLQRYCNGKLNLSLCGQRWQRPMRAESELLGMRSGEYALVREIQLNCGDVPWVYARSIIPIETYRKRQYKFSRLGLKPLANILFADREIFRRGLEIAKLSADSLCHTSPTIHENTKNESWLWGRRSTFYIVDSPLLVTEIFLPELYSCTS